MVTQYPHILTYTIAADAVRTDNGEYTPGAVTASELACRLERNGGGFINGQGGVKIDYAWSVYCQRTSTILPAGTLVTVKDQDGRTMAVDTVKQFLSGQLNTRIWL